MSSAQPLAERLSEAAYLELARTSDTKLEYIDGYVVAMAGASEKHIRITGNIFGTCFAQLRGKPCAIYQSDMRVRVASNGDYTYPDVVVVCGTRQLAPDADSATLLNPTLIVEVLSPSTASRDQGVKMRDYLSLPSLRDYLLVEQDAVRVQRYSRWQEPSANAGWHYTEASDLNAVLDLQSIGCTLPLSAIYQNAP